MYVRIWSASQGLDRVSVMVRVHALRSSFSIRKADLGIFGRTVNRSDKDGETALTLTFFAHQAGLVALPVALLDRLALVMRLLEIGRASCSVRVCQYV